MYACVCLVCVCVFVCVCVSCVPKYICAIPVTIATQGGRLPTEAEWEFGAKGGKKGSTQKFPWGNEFMVDGKHNMNVWQSAIHDQFLKDKNVFMHSYLPTRDGHTFFSSKNTGACVSLLQRAKCPRAAAPTQRTLCVAHLCVRVSLAERYRMNVYPTLYIEAGILKSNTVKVQLGQLCVTWILSDLDTFFLSSD